MSNPVSSANDLLRRASSASNGEILVGLSGGKDSLVVLDLACRSGLFRRVEAYYLYVVRGLDFFERPVRLAVHCHKITLHELPHPMLAGYLRVGECRPHLNRPPKMISIGDVEDSLRERTGIAWLARGSRKYDSLALATRLLRCRGYEEPYRRVHPIWDWKMREAHSYLKARGIPIPTPILPRDSVGFDLKAETLLALKEKAPNDYTKVLKIFPFADAQVRALEQRRRDGHAAIRDGANEPPRDPRGALQPEDD